MYKGCGRGSGGMGHWSTLTVDDCGYGLMYKGCGKRWDVDVDVYSWEIVNVCSEN